MKNINILTLLVLFFMSSCAEKDYTKYVNPFIGTGGHGHTFPGVTLPHGMIQPSPDTRMTGWDACSGYHYSDKTIIGFSHTHLSGTGIGDYGDILLMPMAGELFVNRGEETEPEKGYRSAFSHSNEVAIPGYYSVELKDDNIFAELTATTRTALHRYTFPESDNAAVILDLTHNLQGHKNLELSINIISDTEIEGCKMTRGWAKKQPVYFYAKFSKPFDAEIYSKGEISDSKSLKSDDIKALLKFKTEEKEQVSVKLSISAVDVRGAKQNMEAELAGWDFEATCRVANAAWNEQLSKIDITTSDNTDKVKFYTALYHAAISPNIFIDVDGRYLGQNLEIHQGNKEEGYYTVYSLWDTYRALNPLLTITEPSFNNKLAANLIQKYEEGGCLPKWDLWSNYTGTMTGYHAVSVICEAYLKGARNFDAEKAFEACVHSSSYHPIEASFLDGNIATGALMPKSKQYKDSLGYIPGDFETESVANGLEYAYTDWCIAQFAKALGKDKEYEEFAKKGQYYKNYFNAETGFMRGKLSDGSWREPFDPRASNHRKDDYCEGNAWQWSWYVPHDISGLVELHGSKSKFSARLDSLFSTSSEIVGEQVSGDISGLIGQYAHGNEPSHHITHIYNYIGEPWKCQELVDKILKELYFNDPNGLAGNEDCGQMSAWYLLNSMGLYSIAPASGEYSFGRPIFDKVVINLENGKKLTISTTNNSKENKYIQSIKINGKEHSSMIVDYDVLMSGATIDIEMGSMPNKYGSFI